MKKSGLVTFYFEYSPENDSDTILTLVRVFDTQYIEDKIITFEVFFPITHAKQTELVSSKVSNLYLVNKLFSLQNAKNCTASASLAFRNAKGEPVGIDTDNAQDLRISGVFDFKDCGTSFSTEISTKESFAYTSWGFLLLNMAAIILGLMPLYKSLRDNDLNSLLVLSEYSLLGSFLVDVVNLSCNLNFSLRVLMEYFEFFSFITLFQLLSTLFKMRICLFLGERALVQMQLSDAQFQKRKMIKLFILIAAAMITIMVSHYFIIHYKCFYFVFMYIGVQVLYNAFYNLRDNCFRSDVHIPFFLTQIVFPVCLRFFPENFFKLRQDPTYSLVLLLIVTGFLTLMLCQRLFGPKFFIPKILQGDAFDYYQKVKDTPEHIRKENCPICFIELEIKPDSTNSANKKIMMTPCHHYFHTECLQRWMRTNLICPLCRTNIPLYE